MENNGKSAIKWVAIFGAIVLVVGGLIALSVVIVNNGVSTEDALGGTSRYVRSDIKENSENRGTEIYNTAQDSNKENSEIPYESNIFTSNADSSYEESKVDYVNELYAQLGSGYEDVLPEAVEKDSNGNILIYGIDKSYWDDAIKRNSTNDKLFYKSDFYRKKLFDVSSDDGDIRIVNKSIYLLSCELSSYSKEDVASAKYEISEGKDKYGYDILYVSFNFENGSKMVFEYDDTSSNVPSYVFKSSTFSDKEKVFYEWITSGGTGFSDIAIKDGMYVIGRVF